MRVHPQQRDPGMCPPVPIPAPSTPARPAPERGGHRAGGFLAAAPKPRVSPLSLATSSPFPTWLSST